MPIKPMEQRVDPETGMMDSPHSDGFTLEKKQALLEYLLAPNSPSSLYKAIASMNISSGTFAEHLARDTVFRQKIDEAKKARAKIFVESRLFEDAENPEKTNTLSQLAILRAYYPERYARTEMNGPGNVTINIDLSDLKREKDRAEAIEAQVLGTEGMKTQSVDSQQERVPTMTPEVDQMTTHLKDVDSQHNGK